MLLIGKPALRARVSCWKSHYLAVLRYKLLCNLSGLFHYCLLSFVHLGMVPYR